MKIIRSVKYILFVLYISIFTWIPYLIMDYYAQKHNQIYPGIYGYPLDTPAYLVWMTPEASNGLLHLNLYTNEPHRPVFINVFYIVFGKLFTLLHVPLPFGLLLLRIVFGTLILIVLYKTIGQITKSKKIANLALLFFMLGGGLAQIFIRKGLNTHFETLPGIRIFSFPHSVLAVTLIWLIIYFLMKLNFTDLKTTIRLSLLIGIITCIITLLVPFYFLIIACILLLFCIREIFLHKQFFFRIFLSGLVMLLIGGPYLLYIFFIVLKDPVWQAKFYQAGQIPPTTLLMLLVAFCLYIIFILFDLNLKKILQNRFKFLLWAWLISALVLSIISLPGGWRYIEGITMPLSVLATWGLLNILKLKYYYIKYSVIFLVVLIEILIITQTAFVHFFNTYQKKLISRDSVKAYHWINTHTQKDTVFVSNIRLVIYLPLYTKRKTYFGHFIETNNAREKYYEIEKIFFSGAISNNVRYLIKNDKVCFLIDKNNASVIPNELLNQNHYKLVDFTSLTLSCEQEAVLSYQN